MARVRGIRQVTPEEAREGNFVQTYHVWEKSTMLKDAVRFQSIADFNHKRNGTPDVEVVYTRMNLWGKGRTNDTWQIFVLPR